MVDISILEKEIEEDMMLELRISHIRGRKDFHHRQELHELLKRYQERQKEIENNKKLTRVAHEYTEKLIKTQILWKQIAPTANWEPLPLELYMENSKAMVTWLWLSDDFKPVFGAPIQCKGWHGSANQGVNTGILPGRVSIDSEYGDPRDVYFEKRLMMR